MILPQLSTVVIAGMLAVTSARTYVSNNITADQSKAAECVRTSSSHAMVISLAATDRFLFQCGALSQHDTLTHKVTYPNATLYEDRLASYYSANAALAPWCMVLPLNTDDVSRVAQVISGHECPFGLRSGGHSAFTGSNSVREGITIDFGHMNTTSYNKNNSIASIQPGSNWEMVYTSLDEYNVTVAGGRADVVGVGGFITGGGYSFYSGTVGWGCDNVYNFEVVLGNGSIVNASQHKNSDLFRAMKGGSGNLGLVTRVDMYTIDSTEIWGGYVTYDWSDRAAVFDAYYHFVEDFENDPASQVLVATVYSEGKLDLWSILTNTDAKVAPSAFDKYTAIQNTSDTTTIGSIADLVPEFSGATPSGVYSNWFTGSVSNTFIKEFLEFYYQAMLEYVPKIEAAVTHNSTLSMVGNCQPVTQAFVDQSVERGGNILGLEGLIDDGPLNFWLFSVTVTEQADQPPVLELAKDLVDRLQDYATSLGANKGWHYLNYAYADENPIASYGAESNARIKAASAKYDPQGVFQDLRHSGFKIPI